MCNGPITMRFRPGIAVSLLADDGTVVLAKPFYFTTGGSRELSLRFYSDQGEKIRCVDDEEGIFAFERTGQRLSLLPPTGST